MPRTDGVYNYSWHHGPAVFIHPSALPSYLVIHWGGKTILRYPAPIHGIIPLCKHLPVIHSNSRKSVLSPSLTLYRWRNIEICIREAQTLAEVPHLVRSGAGIQAWGTMPPKAGWALNYFVGKRIFKSEAALGNLVQGHSLHMEDQRLREFRVVAR